MRFRLRLMAPIPVGHSVEITTYEVNQPDGPIAWIATPYASVTDLDAEVTYRSLEPFERVMAKIDPLLPVSFGEQLAKNVRANDTVTGEVLECVVQTGLIDGQLVVQTNLRLRQRESRSTYR